MAQEAPLPTFSQLHIERMKKLEGKLVDCAFFPTYLDCKLPQQFVDVGWGDEKNTEIVCLFGNHLPLSECTDKPRVIFQCREKNYYSVVAFDADHDDSALPFLLWHRVNLHGDQNFSSGKDMVRWQQPLVSGGHHRIFFAVFKQMGGEVDVTNAPVVAKNDMERRRQWNLRAFLQEKRLKFVAANSCCVFSPSCLEGGPSP